MGKKVLWFSRHAMTVEQLTALGEGTVIVPCNKTIKHADEIRDDILACDIVAIVAPVELQKEFLEIADGRPVIMAVNDRVLEKQQNGEEDKVIFKFVKWERLIKIDIVKEDFVP